MSTLQDSIDRIQAVVGNLSGIRGAPDEPPEKISAFPFALCYAKSGLYKCGPAGPTKMTGLHTLVLELHVARKDLPRDVALAMAYAKSIPNALYKDFLAGTLVGVEAFVGISYAFGPLWWGGQNTLGFTFTLEGVKTMDTIT